MQLFSMVNIYNVPESLNRVYRERRPAGPTADGPDGDGAAGARSRRRGATAGRAAPPARREANPDASTLKEESLILFIYIMRDTWNSTALNTYTVRGAARRLEHREISTTVTAVTVAMGCHSWMFRCPTPSCSSPRVQHARGFAVSPGAPCGSASGRRRGSHMLSRSPDACT